mmetsp:Transcript_1603/g.3402  ORF Transcript_1603/g.3402 Transcript_1603/m.3402 type:complete len:366 (+) Transcript_1603:711-1808(+)
MALRSHNDQVGVASFVTREPWRAIAPVVSPCQSTVRLVGNHKPTNDWHHDVDRHARRQNLLQTRVKIGALYFNRLRLGGNLACAILKRYRDDRSSNASVVLSSEADKHVLSTELKRVGCQAITPINRSGVAFQAAVVDRKERNRDILARNDLVRRNHTFTVQLNVKDCWCVLFDGKRVRAAGAKITRRKPDVVRPFCKRPRSIRIGSHHRNRAASTLSESLWNLIRWADGKRIRAENLWIGIGALRERSRLDHHSTVVQRVFQVTNDKLDVIRFASNEIVARCNQVERVSVKVGKVTAVLEQARVPLIVDGVDRNRFKRRKRCQVDLVCWVVPIADQKLKLIIENVVNELGVLIREEDVFSRDPL